MSRLTNMRMLLPGLIVFLVLGCGKNEPAPPAPPNGAPTGTTPPNAGNVLKVTPTEYLAAFSQSKEAPAKYEGVTIEMTVTVESVMGYVPGRPTGFMVNADPDVPKVENILALLTKDKAPWKLAGSGAVVTVRGTSKQPPLSTIRVLSDCEVISVKGEPVPTIDAVQLAKDFAADPKATRERFGDNQLVVTGEAAMVGTPEDTVGLKTGNDVTIGFSTDRLFWPASPTKYKVGDHVEVIAYLRPGYAGWKVFLRMASPLN